MVSFLKKLWKGITSRYLLTSLIIIAQVLLMIFLEAYLVRKFIYFLIASYIVSIATLIFVINDDTIAENKLPWVMLILAFPPFGSLIYIIFGRRLLSIREYKFYKRLKRNERILSITYNDPIEELKEKDLVAYGLAKGLENQTGLPLYKNTNCEYFDLGDTFFPKVLEILSTAKRYIFLETFILSPGYMWDQILEVLKQKVSEGVEVRVLYDDLGSFLSLPNSYYKKLRKLGIKACSFGKFNTKANSSHNNRLHRKIIIVDGNYAFTGGINIADEYINKIKRFGHWKDSGIFLEGEAVLNLLNLFLFDWDLTNGILTDNFEYVSSDMKMDESKGYFLPFGDGPKPFYNDQIAANLFLNMINNAKISVSITTPYLIIDRELTNAICNASRRGVDVKIITPYIPDKKTVYLMTKSSYKHFINNGVKIYEYTPGFIHAKNLICDDTYAVCGTINFDYRSLVHHYEDGVWMYDTDAVKAMVADFKKTVEISTFVDSRHAKLNIFEKFVSLLLKLFAPLM